MNNRHEEDEMRESVLDSPKEGLDPVMWTNDDPPQLTHEAEIVINEVVEWVKSRHQIPELSVLVIGSMTSNSYTANSDVDVDFCSHFMDDKTEDERSDFGWKIKSDFMQNYPTEKAKIGSHPIEIFFQPNQFQCMMSVGCYNFLEKKWEVGPEMKKAGYDPVSDMYEESMKQVKHLVKGIRNIILDVYETSLVILKSDDKKFKDAMCNELLPKLTSAGEMFKRLKKARSAFQKDPVSREDALKKREDRKWKITDAAFKFFDKFGYVTILRECLTLDEKIQAEGMLVDDIAQAIIDVVKDNLATNKLLSDSEKEPFFEVEKKNTITVTESVTQMRLWLDVLFESKKTETNEWGEKQTELGAKSKIFKEVDNIVSSCKTKSFFKSKSGKETDMSTLRLASLAQVNGGHYIATVYGGENGWGEFQSYLKTVKQLVDKIGEKFSKPWLIDWKNDCADDVWTLRFAFRDRDLNESKAPKKDVTPEEAKQYIVDFKNYFGYQDDYYPKENALKISDQIAHECTLQMPTDTAAVEIEGDAVMFLVGTDDQESIRCGMKLGDIMMKKRKAHSNDDRLKAMREAYLELLKHIKNDDINESVEAKSQKTKLWIDDIRKAPDGYLWLKSVDDVMDWIDSNGADNIEVLDIDHDAGDYYTQGGDYIRVLDYLEFLHTKDLKVRIHSANAVGIQNMRRIIKKNGWTEVFDIIAESVETQNESSSCTPQYDRVFREIKQLIDQTDDPLLGVEDHLNRGNKCIKLWHGEVGRNKYGFKDFSKCRLAWNPEESWGLVEVQTFPNHKDLTTQQADEAIEKAKQFISNQQIDEGVADTVPLFILAGLLSIPGLIPQKALVQQFASVPKQELKFSSPSVKKAIQDAAVDKRKFNGLSFVNLTNLVATIIYNEAMIDYVKTQDEKCLIAIANVITNRAGGDPSKFANVISKKNQFFSAKHVKGGYDDSSYKLYDPRSEGVLSKKMLTAWQLANQFAVKAINGTLENVIGNRNMIGNAKLDNDGAWQAWGKDCDLVIGRHSFGYQKDQDGYASHSKQTTKTYVVKAGDTISKIAKKLGVDATTLITKNGLKDPDKISIGQILKF